MALTESQAEFLASNRSAAMITVGADGMPKAVRVSVAVVRRRDLEQRHIRPGEDAASAR